MPSARRPLIASLFLIAFLFSATTYGSAQSKWVRFNAGHLVYAHSPQGDRIADFSYAGYRGGGVALPIVPTRLTVKPSGADDTAAIQSALDQVAKLRLVDGVRGAVLLAPGTFHCSTTLSINASGVVLRGAGDTVSGSTIELQGKPHLALKIEGQFLKKELGSSTSITDAYVPSGTQTIHVANAASIHPGDTLLIIKPATPAWVDFMGMSHLRRSGRDEHWVNEDLKVYRRVAAVSGNTITLTVPLTDDIDSKFLNGEKASVTPIDLTGQLSETGVEDLRITAPARAIPLEKDLEFNGITMTNTVDSWIQNVQLQDTTNSIAIDSGTTRITVAHVDVQQKFAVTTSAKNFQFSCNGSQILFDRCTGSGDSIFYMATQAREEGPVVVLHSTFHGDGHIQPHQRWSTGLLVDNCSVPNGGIDLLNRGTMGSGHGWAIGWSVLWNNTAASFIVQEPPGAANWSIGDTGQHDTRPMPTSGAPKGPPLPAGVIESPNHPVQPPSLYLEQLKERLGPAALTAIGYAHP